MEPKNPAKPKEIPFSWMLRSKFATKSTLDTLFRFFGAQKVLPELYYIRPLIMGSHFLDIREAFQTIHSWQDWIESWERVGEKRDAYGTVAHDEGRVVTARESFLLASAAYQMAQLPLFDEIERKRATYHRAAASYRRAFDLIEPVAECVEIRFGELTMPGYLRIPVSDRPAPVLILVPGADSCKEEMHFFAESLLLRGIGSLSYDGPGIGESWDSHPMILDYERVAGPLLDFLGNDDRIDAARIGVVGFSYGGNLAIRMAAFDPRIAATVSVSGPYDPAGYAEFVLPVLHDQVKLLFHDKTEEAFARWSREFSIRGLVKKVRSPLLVMGGGADEIIPGDETKQIFDEAECEKRLVFFDEGNHLCAEYLYDLVPRMEEWMYEVGFIRV